MIKTSSPSTAIEFYLEAIDIYETEGKERYCVDIFKNLLEIYINLKKVDEAVELLKKEIKFFVNLQQNHNAEKCICSVMILHLSRDDPVSADKFFMENAGVVDYSISEVGRASGSLLQAFKDRDGEAFENSKKSNHLRYLEPSIVRLLRSITVGGGNGGGNTEGEDDLF